MIRRRWKEDEWNQQEVQRLAGELGIEPLVAALVWLRGMRDPATIQHFLHGDPPTFHSPSLLPGIDDAVRRVLLARERDEQILIHGDYDVDGVSGAALLYDFLSRNGWRAVPHVPHRTEEGYGISQARLLEAVSEGVRLLLTVDCGTSAVEETRLAAEHGMDVVITDHHRPPDELPAAAAHVNPHLPGSRYPEPQLSGAGVGYKLCCAITEASDIPAEEAERLLDFVALGTVADMMPLVGENRDLVRHGLRWIDRNRRPGVIALVESCRAKADALSTEDIAFLIAPRLNAAGRLSDPRLALDLLTCKNGEEALDLVQEVERLNVERRAREQEIVRQAYTMLDEIRDLDQRESLVLGHADWHRGVIGLVAARLADRLNLPVAICAIDGDTAYGSARSAGDVDVTDALAQCKDMLVRYGGHRAAAGFQLPAARLGEFRDAFEMAVVASGAEVAPVSTLGILTTLQPHDITRRLLTDLAMLEPYGEGNPRPVFAMRGLDLRNRVQVVGNSHLKVYAPAQTWEGQNEKLDMIGFGKGGLLERLNWEGVDVAFQLGWNDFRGERNVQLKLVDAREHVASEVDVGCRPVEVRAEWNVWDYRPLPRVRRSLCRFLVDGDSGALLSSDRPSRWLAQLLEQLPTAPVHFGWDTLPADGPLSGRLGVLTPPDGEPALRRLGACLAPGAEVHLFWTRSVLDSVRARILSLCPDRSEITPLFRTLQNHMGRKLPLADWTGILVEAGHPAALSELALRVFAELEILIVNGAECYTPNISPPKQALLASTTYRELHERQTAALAWLERLSSASTEELLALMRPAE